jgi:hypothetical protein
MNYSPIFVTNPVGPNWVTGGGMGPEGSFFGIVVAVALLYWMTSVTTDLKYQYAFSELVPGGVAVDIEAAAREQHDAAMARSQAQPAAGERLVQIQPMAAGVAPGPVAAAGPTAAPNEAPEAAGTDEERPDAEPPGPAAS